MRIDVEFVDNIPMVRTGKRQGSISKIQMDFQQIEAPVLATVGAEEVISGNGGVV
jgi:hypothetical protein